MRGLRAFVLCLFFLAACGSSKELLTVKIFSPEGGLRHEFRAEVADDPLEQSQGLMWRRELGKDRGMLFVFLENRSSPFWMKNTLLSLDILFIGEDKRIVSIVERAAPQTTTPREPEGLYRYVLEIEGGRSEDLGIQPGDRVAF